MERWNGLGWLVALGVLAGCGANGGAPDAGGAETSDGGEGTGLDASTRDGSSGTADATSPSTVAGVVTDSTGAVLPGVKVSAGSATTATAADGTFSLTVAPQSKLVVDFSKTGYLESSKPLTVAGGTESHVAAALMAIAPAQPLDATQGGSVTGARGASLTAGPGVLVDASGKVVAGSVDVALTPLSPAVPGELAAYPGVLAGSTNGAAPSLLQTYGVLDVTAMQNGQIVQVAPGKTVTVTIPVAGSGTLPQTEDLWSFDLATGIWDHEGTAQLVGSVYTAQLSHFSYHNIDGGIQNGQATCVTGVVVDTSGKPVAGAYVSPAEGACVDTLITTDANGRYCTWVLSGDSETITADSTAAPFGEGSVTVTGGAAISYPDTYTCSNLNCQNAPNIVLGQPPCATAGDCPSGDTCCTVNGQTMCLESFACFEARGSLPSTAVSDASTSTASDSAAVNTLDGATCPPLGASCPAIDVDASGGACNCVVPTCPGISETESDAGVPTLMGGAIQSGTYVLTSATVYVGGTTCSGTLLPITVADTIVFTATSSSSGTLEVVSLTSAGGQGIESSESGIYVTSGSSITLTATCDSSGAPGGPTTNAYAATPTQVTLQGSGSGGDIAQSDGGYCGNDTLVFTKM